MAQWESASQSDETGYYQVTGIHGVPRVSWDGVEPCAGCGQTDGYCTHDSVLFPAWHRTYVALFEQELVAVAQQIAGQFPENVRATYQAAASTLRLPYWDWAADPGNGPVLPDSISQPQITVTGTSGSQTSITNPLYSYEFSSTADLVYTPFIHWNHTLRYPNSNADDAASQEGQIVSAFAQQQPNLQEQIYQLMSTCNDYLSFSNDDASSSTAQCSNSLESIHNNVHGLCGGPAGGQVSAGHMTYLPLAGFDPIFWLHHANVDRYFALWQNQHPNAYGASQVAPHQTWTIEAGSTQNADSPLTPFHSDTNGDFWTTNGVRDYESAFHYTYPEIVISNGNQAAVAQLINELYGPNANVTAGGVPVSTSSQASSTTSSLKISTQPSTTPQSTTSVATTTTSATATSTSTSAQSTSSVTASPVSTTKLTSTLTTTSPSTTSTQTSSTQTTTTASSSQGTSTQSTSSQTTSTQASSTTSSSSTTTSSKETASSSTAYSSTSSSSSSVQGTTTAQTATYANTTASSTNTMSTSEPSQYVNPYNDNTYQYVANCETNRYALNGSYFVFGFNGQPTNPENPKSWFTDKNSVGLISVVAGGMMSMKMDLLTTGSIPLTRMLQRLVKDGTLKDMSEESALPYLAQHFNWRILGPDGTEVMAEDLPSLKVSVHSASSTQPQKDALPQWSGWKPHPKVTENKAGGAKPGDNAVNYPPQEAAPPAYSAASSAASSPAAYSAGSTQVQTTQQVQTYQTTVTQATTAPEAYTTQTVQGEDVTVTVWETFTATVCADPKATC